MSRRRKRSKKKKKKGGEEEEVAWKKKRRKKEGSLTGNSWSFTRLATVSWIQVWTVVTNRFIKTGQSFSTSFFFLPPPLSMRPVLQPISLSFPISCSCYVLYSREPANHSTCWITYRQNLFFTLHSNLFSFNVDEFLQ